VSAFAPGVCATALALSAPSGCGGPTLAERLATRYRLEGDGIGNLRFSQGPERVARGLERLFGSPSSATGASSIGYFRIAGCGFDHEIIWTGLAERSSGSNSAGLTLYFKRSRFVGYSYGPPYGGPLAPTVRSGPILSTTRGIGLDEPLGRGRRLYGRAFVVTSQALGTPPDPRLERLPAWEVRTARGRIDGFIDAPGGPLSTNRRTIGSISAGAYPTLRRAGEDPAGALRIRRHWQTEGMRTSETAPAHTEGTSQSPRPPVGSVLSDGTILELVQAGRIKIEPWDPELVQPASVDLRLGDSFRVFHNHRASAIDLRERPSGLTEEVVIGRDEPFVIHPGEFCLGRTLEWVELPDDIVARIEGKSSIGRLGLIVHATAGFCDPGWKGTLTLELNNLTRIPIKLWAELPIAQLSFMRLDRPAQRPYGSPGLGSHYQGQRAATESRYEGGPEPSQPAASAVAGAQPIG
jgi:dCTP deaminase